MIHTVKGFDLVNKAEIDIFLELSCRSQFFKFPGFFYDPAYVGNLTSGSSAWSKSSLYIWKLLVHIPLKPSLKDFKLILYSLFSLLAGETSHSQGPALLGLSVLSSYVLIFRWGDYFLLHRTIAKINAQITKKYLRQVYIFQIHSETSLSFNLPNFLPQSHSQLMTCFIFLQIQNNEKRISINSHHHLTLLTSICAKLFCLPS